MTHCVCAHCGTEFSYVQRARPRVYCSRKCQTRAGTLKQNAQRKADGYTYRRTVKGTCAQCGNEFAGRPDNPSPPKYCSKTCGAAASLPLLLAANYKRQPEPHQLVQCKWCHALHTSNTSKYCSDECLQASRSTQARAMRSDLRVAVEANDHTQVIAQLKQRTIQTPDGCWEWQGKRSKDGYPSMWFGKTKRLQVHRLMLEAKHGAPLGSQCAHHMCANTLCINPDHLQPVTHRENIAEMLARHSYLARIDQLQDALRSVAPDHPLLSHIAVA